MQVISEPIRNLLKNKLGFLADCQNDCDVAVSSRIRLARNLADLPFPDAADIHQAIAARDRIAEAVTATHLLGKKMLTVNPSELRPLERAILLERHLVSHDFLRRANGNLLLVKSDESASVMINEEDHLRIQFMHPGFDLASCWQAIDKFDTALGKRLNFAYDDKLGFLTSCPTNVGTGIRASVMLHLPGLVLANQIGPTIRGINKLNLAVRGIYGEGSENLGNLFQVSNQSTLGESEEEIIQRLSAVISQLITHERTVRKQLFNEDKYAMLDRIGRAYGIMCHAYKLTTEEAMQSLSLIKMGVDMDMFNNIDNRKVNELFINVNPGHLQAISNLVLNDQQLAVERAFFCRSLLKKP